MKQKQLLMIKLDEFEGPLDLLLHLIEEMAIDIYDIPIVSITEQYMHYIHQLTEFDSAQAGEYLLLAATLLAIKSKELLPNVSSAHQHVEEDPDTLKERLVQQLLIYKTYQKQGRIFSKYLQQRDKILYSPDNSQLCISKNQQQKQSIDQLSVLKQHLISVYQRKAKYQKEKSQLHITERIVRVEEQMEWLLTQLENTKSGTFVLNLSQYTYQRQIALFLSLLELMKRCKISVSQSILFGPLTITKYVEVDDYE